MNNTFSNGSAGTVVQAQSVNGGIHLHPPGAPLLPPPRQLPPVRRSLLGREDRLAALDTIRTDEDHASPIAVITGLGGVGKTALSAHWLSRLAEHYPDGQFYTDLRASREVHPAPAAVLRGWLGALGYGPALPGELQELAALWRSATADRAVALLIDGAASAAQVHPLLPGGNDSIVVVTGRWQLTELATAGARMCRLPPLSPAASAELLAACAGQGRLDPASAEARRIAAACAGVPLALVMAGAVLAADPHRRPADLAAALERNPHTTLSNHTAEGVFAVTAAAQEIYESLPQHTRRVYRLCTLLPTTDLDPYIAAAAANLPPAEAEHALGLLTGAHLLEGRPPQEGRPARYTWATQLVHRHAQQRAQQEDTDEERQETTRRACEWFLAAASAAQKLLTPVQATMERTYHHPLPEPPTFPDAQAARAWVVAHQHNALPVIRSAHQAQWWETAWQLTDALWPLFLLLQPYEDWIAAHRLGLDAARAAGDAAAERRMLTSGAIGLAAAGHNDEAIRWYEQALELALSAGHVHDHGQSLLGIGGCHTNMGRPQQAEPFLREAITVWEGSGYRRGIGLALITLGEGALHTGRLGKAIEHLAAAHAILVEHGDGYDADRVAAWLGYARALSGDHEAGRQLLERALPAFRAAGSARWQAHTLEWLGEITALSGEAGTARHHYEQAAELFDTVRPADAARVRERLAALPSGEDRSDDGTR
ncbi:tetratricopeptide repeat protein [Streptomyces aidingensis]|uniref:Tetratricopeptide repeat-containing protein n=1 Tax=Streptomyces aidingensis TaxID=910347 RepID=A0A1I1VA08_9ACTN|nr:tetratricopeptide repeat protein [Streptomyces aidingensis]SFD79931.1 Tetratricopeptide repeat-containing protein [Streptomyces aidingensis]